MNEYEHNPSLLPHNTYTHAHTHTHIALLLAIARELVEVSIGENLRSNEAPEIKGDGNPLTRSLDPHTRSPCPGLVDVPIGLVGGPVG